MLVARQLQRAQQPLLPQPVPQQQVQQQVQTGGQLLTPRIRSTAGTTGVAGSAPCCLQARDSMLLAQLPLGVLVLTCVVAACAVTCACACAPVCGCACRQHLEQECRQWEQRLQQELAMQQSAMQQQLWTHRQQLNEQEQLAIQQLRMDQQAHLAALRNELQVRSCLAGQHVHRISSSRGRLVDGHEQQLMEAAIDAASSLPAGRLCMLIRLAPALMITPW